MKDFTIIIPTKNEETIVNWLIDDLEKQYGDFNILFVDNSTDNTLNMINEKAKNYENIKAIHIDEKGVTNAVIKGVYECNTSAFCVADADFQHDFSKIQLIYEKLQDNDIIIGNRNNYSKVFYRKLLSSLSNHIARFVLKIGINDAMSEFFGMKTDLFKQIYESKKKRFVKNGCKVLFDILKSIKSSQPIKIYNFTYDFNERKSGHSKASVMSFACLIKSFLS